MKSIWGYLRILVMLLLVGYFVSKIIQSSKKLKDREIGISLERIREEHVEDSALWSGMLIIHNKIIAVENKLQ